jgi:hypothetical protein
VTEIACTLSEEARRRRAQDLRSGLFRRIASRKRIENGIEVRFHKTDSLLRELADYIAFESRCCAFLRFDLVVESKSEVAMLRLTGPEGTGAFVEPWFRIPGGSI